MERVPVPAERRYSPSHSWVVSEEAGNVRVGITHIAAGYLGDALYLEMPAAGIEVRAGEPVGLIESSWSVFEVVSPVSGFVVEVNPAVIESPERATSDPYGEGWLLRLRMPDPSDLDALMASEDYGSPEDSGA
ncbi:MAG TPA: glycine cleavage system protein GcvH [Candidatus Deferrimicrobiaceae bacterium]